MITRVKTIRGSALIAIIAAILIFSVLAASLIPMIGSSSRQAAISALADEAYMLAESGYRLVESRYRNGDSIEAMDGETFTLADNGGEFRLRIYSYFYEILSAAGYQITANPPGRIPLNNDEDDDQIQFSTGTSLLSIDGNLYTISGYSPETFNQESNLTFTLDSPVEALQPGAIAYPAAVSNSWVWNADTGGSLTYQPGHGGLFPLRHGQIMVGGGIKLNYRYNNREQHRFEGVTNPESPNMDPAIGTNSPIVLTNFSRIHVTGIASGNEREVTYYNALASQLPSTVFEDTTPSEFTVTEPDTTSVEIGSPDASGNQALIITASDGSALLTSSSSAIERALDFYRRNSGGFLSYDAQVKVGFPGSTIPFNAAAGLSFRLNNLTSNINYNGYGLSFARGGADLLGGLLPVEAYNHPLMVLWYQTIDPDNNVSRQWIGYKKLISYIYPAPDNFDDVINNWTSTSALWNVASITNRDGELTQAWRYYGSVGGVLTSPGIVIDCPTDLTSCDQGATIVLTFWSWESGDSWRRLRVFSNGNPVSVAPPTRVGGYNGWNFYAADLTGDINLEETIQIQFEIAPNFYYWRNDGWLIDDVALFYEWPVHNSTLAVRLQEAAVVKFTSGGTEPFEVGDRVYAQTSGVIGTIIADPLVNDPSWSTGNATGAILLNDLSSSNPFDPGERIISIGHTNRGANVDSLYSPAIDVEPYDAEPYNVIKVYYASEAGNPPPDPDNPPDPATPLDAYSLPYPRRTTNESLIWPVPEGGDWTAARDYFRLIQWDEINEDISTGNRVERLTDHAIRHYNSALQSQPLTAGAIGEVGLHAYGTGTTNIYFDDFGLKLVAPPSRGGFTAPFQQ